MKTILLLIAIPVFLALALDAGAVTPTGTGPVIFNLTAAQQSLNYTRISAKTVRTPKATNDIVVYKSSVTNFAVNNDFLIRLLANSFNTNFPAGSQLMITGRHSYTFTVVDKTGTNLFDVSSVLSLTNAQLLNAGTETSISTLANGGLGYSGMDVETFTESAILTYDDTARTTGDGTHSNFQFRGLLTEKWSDKFANNVTAEAIALPGAGGGIIRDQTVILKGTVTAALSSLLVL